jgi:cellulose synthase operon protein C
MENIRMAKSNAHVPAMAALVLAAMLTLLPPGASAAADRAADTRFDPVVLRDGDGKDANTLPDEDEMAKYFKAFEKSVLGTTQPADKTKPVKPPPDNPMTAAELLYMEGKYGAAGDAYTKLLDKKELRVSAAIGLAEAKGIIGKYAEAVEALKKVEADAADRADWHLAMANALGNIGKYEEALARAVKANELRPPWAPAILARGTLLETIGRKADAIEVYKSMSRTMEGEGFRKDARSLVALGQIMDRYAILTGQRASEQAANILHNYLQEAYLKADPKYWPANIATGMFLLSKHRPEAAVKEFALAAKLNKDIPDAFVGMGAITLGQWKFEDCLKQADKALHINPEHPDALLLKAACLMQWRKFDQAAPLAEQVLKSNPNHLEALSTLAALYIRMGDSAKAEPYTARARKINPNYAGLPNAVAEWLAAARQFDRAEGFYREAMKLAPELSEPVTGLGKLYMQTGDEDKALEVFEQANKIDDFRADVVNFLNLLNKMKKYQVRETAHFIVKVDPKYDAILLDQVADYMEKIHKEVTTDLAYSPEQKTIIEFFPTHSDFSVRITGRGWIGTVGASTGRVIALVAPNTERSQFGTHNWATVLRHEYTHTVTLAETKNRIPHWFTEACAVFQQPDKRNYMFVQMLVDATRTGHLFSVKELDWGFIRPQRAGDRSLAYAQSEWEMEYIIETKGYDTVVKMLKAFGDGMTQPDVFEKIVGAKEKDFDENFRKWAHTTVKKWGFNPDPPPDLAKAAKEAKDKPADPVALATYAVALYYRNDFKQAEEQAKKALEKDPKNTKALGVLAVAQANRKAYNEAIETANKLESIDHTTSFAPKVLAQCHIARKNWAEAIPALELLQERQPLDSFSYEQLATIYTQLGQPEKALPNLIHLHRHTMKDPKYARQIAEIYRAMDQNDLALTYFEEITHINPYQPNAYEAMAAIYRTSGQFDKAIAAVDKVCLLQPDSSEAWAKAAMMRYLAGKAGKDGDQLLKAKQAANKSIELDSQSKAKQILERIDAALEELEKKP